MARDLPINTPLYFYDIDSGIYTGGTGDAGDSDDFTLPPGMTPIVPLAYDPATEYAIFDFGLQTWSKLFLDPYLNMTPAEQAAYDKQVRIDAAQDVVTKNLAKALDNTVAVLQDKFILTPAKQNFLDNASTVADLKTVLLDTLSMTPAAIAEMEDFRAKYAAWIAAQA